MTSVFISGDEPDKIDHLMKMYQVDSAKARDIMIKTDKKRSSYYNYYSSKKWSDAKSYDLCINRSAIGFDNSVQLIINFAKSKQDWKKR